MNGAVTCDRTEDGLTVVATVRIQPRAVGCRTFVPKRQVTPARKLLAYRVSHSAAACCASMPVIPEALFIF